MEGGVAPSSGHFMNYTQAGCWTHFFLDATFPHRLSPSKNYVTYAIFAPPLVSRIPLIPMHVDRTVTQLMTSFFLSA